jgi:serine/threonine-protein kinase
MVLRGKYEILEKVGAGGMGGVYRARHKAFGESVALKVLGARLAEDEQFRRRFHTEAVVARRLSHPSAVRVEDLDTTEDGRPFIVMEFVHGRSLREAIRAEGALPPARAVAIARQVASALATAHGLGIVHRDIKPDNIVLTRDPDGGERAKVLDFGISKVKEGVLADELGHDPTRTGLVVGTPQYLSPEQAMGKRGDELDGRADLYSLGVVLYEMVTGRIPFESDTALGVILHHLQTPPTPAHLVRPDLDIPAPLSDLLMKAMEKDRDRRYASALELLAALEALPALPDTVPARTTATLPPLPQTPRPAATSAADIGEMPTLPRVPTPAVPPPLPPTVMQEPARRRSRWWAWPLGILAALVLFGRLDNPRRAIEDAERAAASAGHDPADGENPDSRLEDAVERRLGETEALREEDIAVDVTDGTVYLSGQVSSRAVVELALVLARTVPGARGVESEMEVEEAEPPADPRMADRVPPPPGPPPPGAGEPNPGPPAPPEADPRGMAVRQLLERGGRALRDGDAQAAMAAYKAAMMLEPLNPEASTGLAQAVALLTRTAAGLARAPARPSPTPRTP